MQRRQVHVPSLSHLRALFASADPAAPQRAPHFFERFRGARKSVLRDLRSVDNVVAPGCLAPLARAVLRVAFVEALSACCHLGELPPPPYGHLFEHGNRKVAERFGSRLVLHDSDKQNHDSDKQKPGVRKERKEEDEDEDEEKGEDEE